MGLIWTLVIGFLAGVIAKFIMPGRNEPSGFILTTILGIVGAGGIGFLLADRIGAYRWDEAWSIIFLIIAMVYLIDWLSGRVRARFIGTWEGTR